MTITCPNRNLKEWIELENAVGEFEAYRDYIETKGEIRHPDVVFQKLNNRQFPYSDASNNNVSRLMKATEKMEDAMKADTVRRLREAKASFMQGTEKTNENLISQRSWKETDNGESTLISIPKTLDERDHARAFMQGETPVSRTKDLVKWRELHTYLDQQAAKGIDVSFIQTIETKDAYLIKVPTKIYNMAKKKVTPENVVTYYKGDIPEVHNLDSESLIGHAIAEQGSPGIDAASSSNSQGMDILKSFTRGLSNRITTEGKALKYAFISEADAQEILGKEEWEKALLDGKATVKGFFHADSVYFIGNNITKDVIFHEFSHPVVRTISINQPEVFESLYQEANQSSEGQDIIQTVKSLYPNLEETEPLFKEEVIVRALTKAADLEKNNVEPSSPFMKFIKNLFYKIRQALRAIYGKDFSKLSTKTTIKDLAGMIGTDQIEVSQEALSEGDAVAYVKDLKAYMDDIMKISPTERNALTTRQYDIAVKMIDTVLKNKNYKAMLEILVDEYERGDLQEMRRNLSKFAKPMEDKLKNMRENILYNQSHAEAMINSLFRLQNITTKVNSHLQALKDDPENIDNMNKAFYYDYFLGYWKPFVEEVIESFNEAGLDSSSPTLNLVNSINNNIDKARKTCKSFYFTGVGDVLHETLSPTSARIDKKYTDIISHLKNKKAPASVISKWHEEYYGLTEQELADKQGLEKKKQSTGLITEEEKKLKGLIRKSFTGAQLTRDKINAALKGELGDANVFNSFFEGYTYNTDVVVGGFAKYVKDHLSEVSAIQLSKFNNYAEDLKPLLEKAGYNPANVNNLIQRIANVEKVGRYNDKGEWEEKEIWTLKSKHKDWRVALDRLTRDKNLAEKEYVETGTDEAYQKFIDASAEKKNHLRRYFHQEYQDKVYYRENLLNDEIGKKAAMAMDEIFQKMNMLTAPLTTQEDELSTLGQLDQLWKEYYQLFSLVDKYGQMKDPLSDEYKIAIRLKEYREAGKDPETGKSYYEWKLRKGLFENALEQYEQELVNNQKLDPESEEFATARKNWINKNTRYVIKEDFYKERKDIIDAIKAITSKLPSTSVRDKAVADAFARIFDITASKRDEEGQPDGGAFTEENLREIHDLQSEIQSIGDELDGLSSLNKIEENEMKTFRHMFKNKVKLTPDQQQRYDVLLAKESGGLSSSEKKRLKILFEKLRNMQTKEPTQYYMEIVEGWLSEMDPHFVDVHFKDGVNEENVDKLEQAYLVQRMFDQSPAFEKWFRENHLYNERFDYEVGDMVGSWTRTYAWTAIKPSMAKYYEKESSIKVDIGNKVPKLKYYVRKVKDEYRTKHVVGETVDNIGNYLPREDVYDSPYIDRDYLNMKNTDPAHYAILEKMKEHHLKNQEGVPRKSRLYLDVPRFRKNNLELLRTKEMSQIAKASVQGKLPLLYNLIGRARNFFIKAKDQKGITHNWDDNAMLVRMDMFDNEITNIPIHGLSDIEIDDVSPDVNQSLMRYMFSLETQKKLIQINPVAQALKSTVNDPDNMAKQLDKINKFNFLNRGAVTYLNKKGFYARKWAVNNFIEREFEGKVDAGFTKNMPALQNFTELILKRASFSFFALNIPSALKNTLGAKFQSMIEASGGAYVNHAGMAKGEAWATNTMGQISMGIYSRGAKALNIQIVDAFDAIRGRAENKLPESMSRTFAHDVANLSWLYNFRKWTQDQAELQLFGGMMYTQTLERNGKKMSYMDAWEVKDNQLSLKEGIDVRYAQQPTVITIDKADTIESLAKKYGIPKEDMDAVFGKIKPGREITIDNTFFKDFRSRYHTVQISLNGAYDRFDQPEAQRYLAFRMISFMRRYFTPMLMNRWGFSGSIGRARGRLNPGLGDMQEGYYITAIKTISRIYSGGQFYFPFMTTEEKSAWKKVATEAIAVTALLAVIAPLLGWDPEDPERYEKLRARSGNLPFLGLAEEDPAHPFQFGGFMMNHALKLALDVRAENEAFIPFPNYGLDDYTKTATEVGSVGYGPTLKTYRKMIEYLYMEVTGNPYARYQKDVGSYGWQKEGGSKFVTEFGKALGLTGSSIDPVTSIKNTYGSKR